jgi:hypothetical protein
MVGPRDGARPQRGRLYVPAMKTPFAVAPRRNPIVQFEPHILIRASRRRRTAAALIGSGFALALALGACNTPAVGSAVPASSVALPSVDASAAASVASQAALAALDRVDAAITANTSATGLSADDAAALTQLTAGLRTALQSGDMTGAKTAFANLSTKANSLAPKFSGAAGTQMTDAVATLKSALGG